MTKPQVTDEQLSALIDDALTPAARRAVEAALADDVALQARFDALRRADAAIAATYRSIDETPLPDAISRLLAPPALSFAARPRRWGRFLSWPALTPMGWAMPAMAASVALLIGLGLGLRMAPPPNPQTSPTLLSAGFIAPDNPLHQVLERVPSGTAASFESGRVVVTPVLSFADVDGGYCREFRFFKAAQASRAVACRADQGWLVHMTVAETPTASGDGYQIAAAPLSRQFDAAVNAMISERPLDAAAEAQLLQQHWRH